MRDLPLVIFPQAAIGEGLFGVDSANSLPNHGRHAPRGHYQQFAERKGPPLCTYSDDGLTGDAISDALLVTAERIPEAQTKLSRRTPASCSLLAAREFSAMLRQRRQQ